MTGIQAHQRALLIALHGIITNARHSTSFDVSLFDCSLLQHLLPAMAAPSAVLQNARVLISGASIAGPALALWLAKYGFDVTVVEKAQELRRGGLPVDFKGATHMTVLRRMGILEDIRRAQVRTRSPTGRRSLGAVLFG